MVLYPLARRLLAQISEPETGSQVETSVRQNPNFCSPSQWARPQVNSSPQSLRARRSDQRLRAQKAQQPGKGLPESWPDVGTAGDRGHGPQGQPVAPGPPGPVHQEGGQDVQAKTV